MVLELLLAHDGVHLDYDDCIGVTYDDVRRDPEAALGAIVARFKVVEAQCDAVIVVGGKPYKSVSTFNNDGRFHLVTVDYDKPLQSDYMPARLTSADYPNLISKDEGQVDTIAVPAVLAAYNWPTNTDRYRKLALFVDAFFAKFPTFQNPPFHPKWKETSLSAPLPGWQRLPAAQQWLDSHGIEQGMRSRFESFLQQNPAAARSAQSEADKEALFRQFQAWQADQASKDAQAQAQATDRPARRPRNQQ